MLWLALAAAIPASAASSTAFVQLRQTYLDGLFRAKPHLATFLGDHRHDGELPDYSDAGVQRRIEELAAQRKALDAIDRKALSVDEQVDARILQDGVDLELLYLKEIREWTWNPRLADSFPFYDPREIVADRLSEIVHGTFAPEATRRQSAVSQLTALPAFLATAKAALKNPSRVHLDQGIKDNQGRISFFESELKAFTHSDPAAEKARVQAVAALRDYQSFLEKFPKASATHDWKLGAALYAKKFPLALQTDLSPSEVATRATEAFKKARADLYEVALRLHHRLWPAEPVPARSADPKLQSQVISRVRDELSKQHPQAAELVTAHARVLDELREFIEQKDLLSLPPQEMLRVEAMPEYKRGAASAEYLSPGMLDKTSAWRGTFFVDPIDPTWPAEKVESYLRGQNNYEVTLTAAHEAYPGHHVQAWYARRDLNPLRAALWSGPMAEGWAVYGESLLTLKGLGGDQNDRYRFIDLRGQMVVASNAVLDILLQTGQMTDEQAIRLMVEEGFQEAARAEKKLLRAKLDSTQLVQYFLGYSEIKDLEREYQNAQGKRFSQRALDEGLVGHGTIAVKLLRVYLLGK